MSKQIADDTFDVVLKITGTVTVEGNTAFLIEVHQAGIFVLKGFEPKKLRAIATCFLSYYSLSLRFRRTFRSRYQGWFSVIDAPADELCSHLRPAITTRRNPGQ